jgi:uncharacterized membrane protein
MAAAKPRTGSRTAAARGKANAKATGGAKNGATKGSAAKNGAAKNGAAKTPAAPSPVKAARTAAPARAKSGADAARPAGPNGTRRPNPARNRPVPATGPSRRGADPEPAVVGYEYPAAWLRWATFVLALAGLGVSIYLTYAHYTESALAGCTETTGVVNCGKVTTSAQSVVFGIPVAVLGLAFYVFAVAIMSPWAWKARRREVGWLRLASLVVGIGFVLYLIYAELFDIGSICLYCTSVHVITFVLFVLTGLAVAVWGFSPRAQVAPPSPSPSRGPSGR